jgi:hypothetical protein
MAFNIDFGQLTTTGFNLEFGLGGGGSPPANDGYVKVWNGSAWVIKPVKVWTGAAWVIKPAKFWNGSAWITTSPT